MLGKLCKRIFVITDGNIYNCIVNYKNQSFKNSFAIKDIEEIRISDSRDSFVIYSPKLNSLFLTKATVEIVCVINQIYK